MIYVQRTYVKELLLGSLHGVGEPGQGFQAVDGRRLNDTLNDTVLTFQYTEDLESAHMEAWGAARKVARRGKGSKSRYAACGLWVGLHAPARSMRYMCNVCT